MAESTGSYSKSQGKKQQQLDNQVQYPPVHRLGPRRVQKSKGLEPKEAGSELERCPPNTLAALNTSSIREERS